MKISDGLLQMRPEMLAFNRAPKLMALMIFSSKDTININI